MLDRWYGVLAFLLFDLIAFIAVAAITYRWFFKRVFDFLVSGVCLIALSPVYLILYLRAIGAKKRGEIEKTVLKTKYIGKKGKTVYLRRYALGKECGQFSLYSLIDVFCGKLSFVGCMPFRPSDAEFLDSDEEERHRAKPGLLNPLLLNGDGDTTYDDMVENDVRYAEEFSLWTDCKIFFTWILKKIRGEGKEYLGEANRTSYANSLLTDERISKEDYERALALDKEIETEEV